MGAVPRRGPALCVAKTSGVAIVSQQCVIAVTLCRSSTNVATSMVEAQKYLGLITKTGER